MEFFQKAKSVRLHSYHEKYLLADDDEESVCQERNGSVKRAKWEVELVKGTENLIRLKSCYGKYLTASNVPYLLGMTGKKVLQTVPRRLDSSVQWEPIREGVQVKLRTQHGNYLRANGRLPPWRNSVTHDIPHRTSTQEWILWEVDMLEIQPTPPASPVPSPSKSPFPSLTPSSTLAPSPSCPALTDSKTGARPWPRPRPPPAPSSCGEFELPDPFEESKKEEAEDDDAESMFSLPIPRHSNDNPHKDQDHDAGSSKSEGRTIYYKVADENGDVTDTSDGIEFTFKGTRLEELVEKLESETGHEDIILCSHWNGKLYPLRLQLPPNNAAMHIVIVPPTSRVVGEVEVPGS